MKKLCGIGILLVLATATVTSLSAQQVYITNEGNAEIQLWDLSTNKLSTLYTIGVGKEYNPDDLTLNAAGQLIYSVFNAGTIDLYDPVAKTNTVLATGIAGAYDVEVEPGGQSMLIARHSAPAEIIRLTFSNNSTSVLLNGKPLKITTMDGIAYDPFGNLYAVANHNTIIQINPTTGAVLNTLVLEVHNGVNGADGLTYDSYTGELWGTHDGKTLGSGLIEIPVSPSGGFAQGYKFIPLPGIANVDGIKSDGKGNLYIGAIYSALQYNIPTNTITKSIVVKGADGVSLVPGTY
jgi:hypothetical protein